MAPIPSRAEITQATLSMRSHFAAVSLRECSERQKVAHAQLVRLSLK